MQSCSAGSGVQKLNEGVPTPVQSSGLLSLVAVTRSGGLPVTVTCRMLSQATEVKIVLDEQGADGSEEFCC